MKLMYYQCRKSHGEDKKSEPSNFDGHFLFTRTSLRPKEIWYKIIHNTIMYKDHMSFIFSNVFLYAVNFRQWYDTWVNSKYQCGKCSVYWCLHAAMIQESFGFIQWAIWSHGIILIYRYTQTVFTKLLINSALLNFLMFTMTFIEPFEICTLMDYMSMWWKHWVISLAYSEGFPFQNYFTSNKIGNLIHHFLIPNFCPSIISVTRYCYLSLVVPIYYFFSRHWQQDSSQIINTKLSAVYILV